MPERAFLLNAVSLFCLYTVDGFEIFWFEYHFRCGTEEAVLAFDDLVFSEGDFAGRILVDQLDFVVHSF